jgi:ParB-like chromosome segregation protein Spo0J
VFSRAELARKLGVSRARVTQVLGLLNLSPKVLRKMSARGDPMERPVVTERQLRPLVRSKTEDQERLVTEALQRVGKAPQIASE